MRRSVPTPDWWRRRDATEGRRPGSSPGRRRGCRWRPPALLDARRSARPLCRCHRGLGRTHRCRCRWPMRSPFAYVPRPRPPAVGLAAGAAVAYLGSLAAVAFLYSSPLVLVAAGVGGGARRGARRGARGRSARRSGWALRSRSADRRRQRAGRRARRDVLARLGEWPLLGRVDVTAEAIAEGAVIGLRAARRDGRLRRLLRLRRPRPGAASAAAVRGPLGPDRDADLPLGPGRRGGRRPPARRRPSARPRRRSASDGAACPPPARRLARPCGGCRGDSGAAGYGLAGAAIAKRADSLPLRRAVPCQPAPRFCWPRSSRSSLGPIPLPPTRRCESGPARQT